MARDWESIKLEKSPIWIQPWTCNSKCCLTTRLKGSVEFNGERNVAMSNFVRVTDQRATDCCSPDRMQYLNTIMTYIYYWNTLVCAQRVKTNCTIFMSHRYSAVRHHDCCEIDRTNLENIPALDQLTSYNELHLLIETLESHLIYQPYFL